MALRSSLILLLLVGTGASAPAETPPSCSGGGEPELACWFERGLDLQTKGDAQAAADAYERALEIDPNRGSVLNNLAVLQADLGHDAEAERRFESAVSQEERLRPFYRRNFGDFLVRLGRWEKAEDQYRRALEEAPGDYRTQEGLLGILTAHRPEAIPEYVRFLISHGQVLWARDIALARLQEQPTEEYLSLLVQALAQGVPSADELLSERTTQVLQDLTSRSDLGEGAQEILRLARGDDFEPVGYGWWAEGDRSQVFRSLARSFGDAQRQAGKAALARDSYRLAAILSPEKPDLLAVRRIVNLPYADDNVGTVDALARSAETRLKGSASPAERYLYRHDLGLFYAALEDWGDRCQPAALHHLEKAVDLDDYRGDAPFDGRVEIALVEGYIATGQPGKAKDAWKDLVTKFYGNGLDDAGGILVAVFHPGPEPTPDIESLPSFEDPPLLPHDLSREPPDCPREDCP